MTDANTKPTTGNRSPSHIAYLVRDISKQSGDKNAIWTRIGSAWQHADGNGFNIQIKTLPLDGRITLRVASDKKD